MTSLLTSCHILHVCWHYKCLFYSDLPQTTINKAINDLRKRLKARVLTHFGHFAHIMWTRLSSLMCHNFVKVGDNCIEICNLAYIRTCNGRVKNWLKILNRLWKNEENSDIGGFFWLTLYIGHLDVCDLLIVTFLLFLPVLNLLLPLELFVYLHLIIGILSLCLSARLTVLLLLYLVLNLTFSLLPITSSHSYTSASDSTFDYWCYISIWLTLTIEHQCWVHLSR